MKQTHYIAKWDGSHIEAYCRQKHDRKLNITEKKSEVTCKKCILFADLFADVKQ